MRNLLKVISFFICSTYLFADSCNLYERYIEKTSKKMTYTLVQGFSGSYYVPKLVSIKEKLPFKKSQCENLNFHKDVYLFNRTKHITCFAHSAGNNHILKCRKNSDLISDQEYAIFSDKYKNTFQLNFPVFSMGIIFNKKIKAIHFINNYLCLNLENENMLRCLGQDNEFNNFEFVGNFLGVFSNNNRACVLSDDGNQKKFLSCFDDNNDLFPSYEDDNTLEYILDENKIKPTNEDKNDQYLETSLKNNISYFLNDTNESTFSVNNFCNENDIQSGYCCFGQGIYENTCKIESFFEGKDTKVPVEIIPETTVPIKHEVVGENYGVNRKGRYLSIHNERGLISRFSPDAKTFLHSIDDGNPFQINFGAGLSTFNGNGELLFINDSDKGFLIVDISNVNSAKLVSKLPGKFSPNYTYIDESGDLFLISNFKNEIFWYKKNEQSEFNLVSSYKSEREVFVDLNFNQSRNLLYVSTRNLSSFLLLNTSNDKLIKYKSFKQDFVIRSFVSSSDFSKIYAVFQDKGVGIFELQNDMPVLVDSLSIPDPVLNIVLSKNEKHIYLANHFGGILVVQIDGLIPKVVRNYKEDGLYIVDLELSSVQSKVYGIGIQSGKIQYRSYQLDSLGVVPEIDSSSEAIPFERKKKSKIISAKENIICTVKSLLAEGTTFCLDVSDLSKIKDLGSFRGTKGPSYILEDDVLVVADYDKGISFIDINSPEKMKRISFIKGKFSKFIINKNESVLYAINFSGFGGISLFDISDRLSPKFISTYVNLGRRYKDLDLSQKENVLALSRDDNRIEFLDISSKTDIKLLSLSNYLKGRVENIALNGNDSKIYLSFPDKGIGVYDVKGDFEILHVYTSSTSFSIKDMVLTVDGKSVLLAGGINGQSQFELKNSIPKGQEKLSSSPSYNFFSLQSIEKKFFSLGHSYDAKNFMLNIHQRSSGKMYSYEW